MYREYYINHLNPVKQSFYKAKSSKMKLQNNFTKLCYNNCIRSTLQALDENDNTKLYTNIMALIYIYE